METRRLHIGPFLKQNRTTSKFYQRHIYRSLHQIVTEYFDGFAVAKNAKVV